MKRNRINVCLDDEQQLLLKHLAAEQGRSMSDLARQAVGAYWISRARRDRQWSKRFKDLIDGVQANLPPGVTLEEIEADIAEVSKSLRKRKKKRAPASKRRTS